MWISIQLHWLVIETCVHSDQQAQSCYINYNDQEKEQEFI